MALSPVVGVLVGVNMAGDGDPTGTLPGTNIEEGGTEEGEKEGVVGVCGGIVDTEGGAGVAGVAALEPGVNIDGGGVEPTGTGEETAAEWDAMLPFNVLGRGRSQIGELGCGVVCCALADPYGDPGFCDVVPCASDCGEAAGAGAIPAGDVGLGVCCLLSADGGAGVLASFAEKVFTPMPGTPPKGCVNGAPPGRLMICLLRNIRN